MNVKYKDHHNVTHTHTLTHTRQHNTKYFLIQLIIKKMLIKHLRMKELFLAFWTSLFFPLSIHDFQLFCPAVRNQSLNDSGRDLRRHFISSFSLSGSRSNTDEDATWLRRRRSGGRNKKKTKQKILPTALLTIVNGFAVKRDSDLAITSKFRARLLKLSSQASLIIIKRSATAREEQKAYCRAALIYPRSWEGKLMMIEMKTRRNENNASRRLCGSDKCAKPGDSHEYSSKLIIAKRNCKTRQNNKWPSAT